MHVALTLLIAHIPAPTAGPHWTAYLTALVAPIVALIAAWIALRQWQLARNKLKLDLFDRRMAVYESARRIIGKATGAGTLTNADEIDYLSGIQTAKWLFGQEVQIYLEKTLWHKIVDFGLHNTMSSSGHGEERAKHFSARAETLQWLMDQYAQLDKMCGPYLKLGH